jgi:Tfp pilus assembly protein PilO
VRAAPGEFGGDGMTDFWDNAVRMSVAALAGFFLWGLGYLMLEAGEQEQVRYEQCIAADKQWFKGSCVK